MAQAYGLELPDIPAGCTPLELVVVVKALDSNGSVVLCERISDGLSRWEALGMLTTMADTVRTALVRSAAPTPEDDD